MIQGRLEDHLGTASVGCECMTGELPMIQARPEIARMRAAGYGWTTIAASLNTRGVPTPSGRGRWYPDSARRHVEPEPWRQYIRRYRARQRGTAR